MIDPGERWAYAIGVKPVLTQEVERITVKQRGKAATLEETIRKLAKQLCDGSLIADFQDSPEYKFLLDSLSQKFNEGQVEAMIASIPDDAKLPYMTVAKRQFDFLNSALPKNTFSSVAGDQNLDISDPEMFNFEVFYQVANDPLSMFGFMCQAALLESQVSAFKEMFPTMYKAIDAAIGDAIIDHTASTGEPTIDPFADLGIKTWRGIKVDVVPYQAVYVEASQRKETKPNPSDASQSRLAKESLTPSQRALYDVSA